MNVMTIPLSHIDLSDERFRISRFFDLEPIKRSIREIGLCHPPVITERQGRGVLVTGWKRVLACQALSHDTLPVRVSLEQDDLKTFAVALSENRTVREFSLVEKAEILQRLREFRLDEKAIIRDHFPSLGIPPTRDSFDFFSSLNGLEPGWKKWIHQKKIPMAFVRLLVEFSPEERQKLHPVIQHLTLSQQRQLFEDLLDASRKRGVRPLELLKSRELLGEFETQRPLSRRRATRLLTSLRRMKAPHLSSWEEAFLAACRRARLSRAVIFDRDRFFEDGEFRVRLSLQDREAFRRDLNGLEKLLEEKALFALFQPHSDE
ncbi:MAG: ParB/RepB/Spo0J family partition protein [Candidatus Aminicenantales bacterium]